VVGQETSMQWASSHEGACVSAGIELGVEMARLSFVEWLASGVYEQHRYQLKFMEWGQAEVEEEPEPAWRVYRIDTGAIIAAFGEP